MKVPKNLNSDKFRFIKLRGKTKIPLEKNWTNNKNYSFEEISKWVSDGNNYGVATGFGKLGVIDCDLEILDYRVKELLPKTFTVQTGSGGKHYYYIIKDLDKKYILYYNGNVHAGELQWEGQQVVGAESIHPDTKKPYKVIDSSPIATIELTDLLPLLTEFERCDSDKDIKNEQPKNSYRGYDLPISKVIEKVESLQEFKQIDDNTLQGSHPVHGSSTKFNFNIDLENNLWHCFRCEVGGDTISLIAMLEGIIACEDVGKKKLQGKNFKKVLKIAREKYGFSYDELEQKDFPEEPKSLNDVYDTFKKYIYMNDTNTIDLALATALTNQKKGTPVWMIFVGASSGGKSIILRALSDIPKAMVQDDITPNTLASGAKDAKTNNKVMDLGMKLQNKSTLIITPDLASMSAHNRDTKREIWSKLRELFDGFINRSTGNGVFIDYKDCHVTWVFGATPSIRSEVLIYATMGTRELMFDVNMPDNLDDIIMERAWENENYESEMKQALQDVVRKFYKSHPYKNDIEVPDSMRKFIQSEAKRLEYLRATAPTDKNGELLIDVCPAKPYRAMKQLKKIYIGLKSLDESYSDARAKEVIRAIVDSSSEPVRMRIMWMHEDAPDDWFSYSDYKKSTKVSRFSLKKQAMALWNIGYLERKIEVETSTTGRVKEFEYFRKNQKSEFQFVRN